MSASESTQFEGPEKLLEIWFAPSPADVKRAAPPTEDGKYGLRRVEKALWEEMLDIVKCKILSVIEGSEMDAYLLRSVTSLFFIEDQPYIHLISCSFFYTPPAALPVDYQRIVALYLPSSSHSKNLRNDAQPLRAASHP